MGRRKAEEHQSKQDLLRKVQRLEQEKKSLLESMEELRQDSAVRDLRQELLQTQKAHLADVEQGIRMAGEYLELTVKLEQDEQSAKWKSAYESLANSKLGRLQRFYWRITEKRKRSE